MISLSNHVIQSLSLVSRSTGRVGGTTSKFPPHHAPITDATMFPTPTLLKARLQVGGWVNARILKDHSKRVAYAANEERRQALRYPSSLRSPDYNG
jgi:hypothetical protein